MKALQADGLEWTRRIGHSPHQRCRALDASRREGSRLWSFYVLEKFLRAKNGW
jgi:hypothetical protein